MDAKIKADWVAALRSGKYVQATGALREECAMDGYSYCCLGVLCDIVGSKWDEDGQAEYEGSYSSGLLPRTVASKVGIDDPLNCYEVDPYVWVDGSKVSLSELNDSGVSFETIAGIIEDQL